MREGVQRQETGDMGKTGDRRREMGDNALTSKADVQKSNLLLFLEYKILAPFIMLRLGCSKSPLKEETLSHFLKTSKVPEVTPTVV